MNTQMIQAGLDYIEQNLKAVITAEELSGMAGYSKYHYCRLFYTLTGSPVAGYILKRRLDHALTEIAAGRKAIDVVLEYGFDTYAGFYKAFIKMYGCSPKKYISIYQNHTPTKPEVISMYTEKELRKTLESWDIPQGLPIEDIYIMDGAKVSGKVWQIGAYILKSGERSKLMKNMAVTKALDRQGFSASVPIPTKMGTEYVNNDEIFILSHSIKGKPLNKEERYGTDRFRYASLYGQSIARLHKALLSVENHIAFDDVNLFKTVMDWALPNVRQQNKQWDMAIKDDFFTDYEQSFGSLYEKLPRQVIHRDPNPSNILFDNGEVSGFIDFDFSERNIRLLDPCYCATGILSEPILNADAYEKWLDILKAILSGYDRENSLTCEEKQAVFYVICSIQMICIAYFESVDEYKHLAVTNRRMLLFIIQNKERIEAASINCHFAN